MPLTIAKRAIALSTLVCICLLPQGGAAEALDELQDFAGDAISLEDVFNREDMLILLGEEKLQELAESLSSSETKAKNWIPAGQTWEIELRKHPNIDYSLNHLQNLATSVVEGSEKGLIEEQIQLFHEFLYDQITFEGNSSDEYLDVDLIYPKTSEKDRARTFDGNKRVVSKKSLSGLLYLLGEYDSNPNQESVTTTSVSSRDKDDLLWGVYLVLNQTWNQESSHWKNDTAVSVYESNYQDQSSLNLRSLSLGHTISSMTKRGHLSSRIQHSIGLMHLDYDNRRYSWTAHYSPSWYWYNKNTRTYWTLGTRAAFSDYYGVVYDDQKGPNYQIDLGWSKSPKDSIITSVQASIHGTQYRTKSSEYQYIETGLNLSTSLKRKNWPVSVRPYATYFDRRYEVYSSARREDWRFLAGASIIRTWDKTKTMTFDLQKSNNDSNDATYHYRAFKSSVSFSLSF